MNRKRRRSGQTVSWPWWLCSLGFYLGQSVSEASTEQSVYGNSTAFDYYDRLRLDVNTTTIMAPPLNTSSGILQVTTSDDNQTYRLASLQAFLPLTDGGIHLAGRSLDDAFALLLAIYHFNNYHLYTIDGDDHNNNLLPRPPVFTGEDIQTFLSNCNIRLTTDIVDSQMSSAASTFAYVNLHSLATGGSMLENGDAANVTSDSDHHHYHNYNPQPITAVVGAYLSAVNAPLAILTGATVVPQVSWSTTAVGFEDKTQYPYFGRTISTTQAEAAAALRFFQTTLRSTHIAVLYVTDQFGSSLRTTFAAAAAAAGVTTVSLGVAASGANMPQVLQQLAAIDYRHIYAIVFDAQLTVLAETAVDLGLVGPDYAYLLHGPDASDWQWQASRRDNMARSFSPSMVLLLNGAGIVQPMGGLLTPDDDKAENSTLGFARFAAAWQEAHANDAFTNYVTSKLPSSLEETISDFDRRLNVTFTDEPGAYRPFLYDAVMGLGIAMCRAGENVTYFDGPSIAEEFRQLHNLSGVSGTLNINPATGTRKADSVTFVLWNVWYNETTEGLEFRPSVRLRGFDLLEISGGDFRFADGSFDPPPNLPALQEDYNHIGRTGRFMGYGMFGFTTLSALVFLVWLRRNRFSRVVYAAQPMFLYLVAIGSIVSVSSLIPLGVEETTVSSTDGLDFACMVTPWLYVIGSNITLSALLSKTRKVYQAYLDPTMEYIHLQFLDIMRVLMVLLLISGAILTAWTVVAPLEWSRIYRSNTDVSLRLTDSYGECRSDSGTFAAVLVTVNFCYLFLGSVQAAATRHVETEYKESQYVNVALFSILQAWTMGIAILLVTNDDARARFYVLSGIVFVTSLSSLAFVFVPKMLALQEDIRMRGRRAFLRRDISGKLVALPEKRKTDNDASSAGGAMANEHVDATSQASADNMEFVSEGTKVLHNPKSSRNLIASGGNQFSRAQMREYVRSQSQEFDIDPLSQRSGPIDVPDTVVHLEENSEQLNDAGEMNGRFPTFIEGVCEDPSTSHDNAEVKGILKHPNLPASRPGSSPLQEFAPDASDSRETAASIED